MRARSGGAVSHLLGIMSELDWNKNSDIEIHIWAYPQLLNKLPINNRIYFHSSIVSNKSILMQLMWERFILPYKLKKNKCDILLNVDAGSLARYQKMITMSRDMLSYESGEMDRFPFSKEKIRLILLKYVQNSSLRSANGVIFLTNYAGKIIQKSCGKLKNIRYIPHGVGKIFLEAKKSKNEIGILSTPIRVLYISNIAPYKHQWNVVRAINCLRKRGYDINLTLTGGGHVDSLNGSQKKLDNALQECDPESIFVTVLGYISHSELPMLLHSADIFVFASSCENMPNTLIEAMSVGLPIACSNRGPMPEVLENGGVYFDPDDFISIANSIEIYLKNKNIMIDCSKKAQKLSIKYSWARCAAETIDYIRSIHNLN